jgi:predicted transcriptional regulator of viral defense system
VRYSRLDGLHVLPAGIVTSGLASPQEGTVTRQQLLDAGLSRHEIQHRIQTGQLHRCYRGVYLVGHTALAPHAIEFAAVQAYGEGAVISHRSAAFLWSMIEHRPEKVDVTLVRRHCRARDGLRLHLSQIDRRDVRHEQNLPVTPPREPLIDLAAVAGSASSSGRWTRPEPRNSSQTPT